MNENDRGERRRQSPSATRFAWLAGLVVVTWAAIGHAQVGTGGVVGTTGGMLSDNDFFVGVQKVEGINLSDVDKARFLNHASCQCKRDVWIKAILASATSAATAQRIAGTDVVSMVVGFACDNTLYRNSCLTLDQTSLSQFRLSGMTVHTTVDALAKSYGVTTTVITTVTGTGGDTGSGGTTGSGGSTGSEITTATDPCAVGDAFMQTVYILVESSPGVYDGNGKQTIVIDGTPPPTLSSVTVGWANEALVVGWTPLDSVSVPDLQGYQVFCSRTDQYQVFKDGTFTTSVDSCPSTDAVYSDGGTSTDGGSDGGPMFPSDLDPRALINTNTHYICSDFLSTSTSSHRVQILQNDISYGIAVAAVDAHGNASMAFPTPLYTSPMPTIDFYQHYRSGNRPEGQATGGCSVGGDASGTETLWALAALGVVIGFSPRRHRGRRA